MKRLLIISAVSLLTIVTTSSADVLPSDDFNDNSINTSLWNLFESDPCNEWLDETNQRLEMRSTADANDTGTIYFANGWGFLTANNFSFKADFHNSFTSDINISAWANVMLGLAKGSNLAAAIENNAIVQAAWDTGFYPPSSPPYSVFDYSYTVDGNESSFQEQRDSIDGTLYVSYDAGADELYLSHIGYWKTNASAVIPGLLKGEWGSAFVIPFLGGSTYVSLDSGVAYLDNFIVDSGTVVPVPANVLPLDDFNDNSRNTSMWNLFQESPNVWLDEANQRLEVRSTADMNGATVVYYANGWGFLTANNFSFKADFYISSISIAGDYEFGTGIGILTFGGNPATIMNNNAGICPERSVDEYNFGCYHHTNGNEVEDGSKTRNQDSGTLYVSYDASKDELYLSDTGYWATNAWVTIPGLVKGEWGSTVVIPGLVGDYVRNVALNSGDVYLDNFVVDSGKIVPVPAIYFYDLENFCEHWLDTGCINPFGCEGTDLNNDTDVDFSDYAIFAQNWLKGI